jgi:hypothetical protein
VDADDVLHNDDEHRGQDDTWRAGKDRKDKNIGLSEWLSTKQRQEHGDDLLHDVDDEHRGQDDA